MTQALPCPPHPLLLEPIVRRALEEDLGRAGDITSELVVPARSRAKALLKTREPGRIAGLICAEAAFRLLDATLEFRLDTRDGTDAEAGASLATLQGSARAILAGERVALNFVGRLSGVATQTRALAEAVAGTKAQIVCTRKTTPGLRLLEKYAVRCGGGLDDAVLIKDNHILVAGGLAPALERARAGAGHMMSIEVEVETLDQLEEALRLGVNTILLDNMGIDELKRAVEMTKGRAVLEASGNVTLATARAIAETGVDYISSGAITHSAPCLDVTVDF